MSVNRRPLKVGSFSKEELRTFSRETSYEGSAHHKSKASDYGLTPAISPRPTKSLCDDVRIIPAEEANRLLKRAFELGMVSDRRDDAHPPKYAWAIDEEGEVYEAKLGNDGLRYHGYRLSKDDGLHKWLVKEWRKRNQ
ncbi:MAG: hypothetical protein OXG25_09965 [Gammaproteobacteria bacterium]|nr:hypothetical protein [Gammaproteobacteria bacterium]